MYDPEEACNENDNTQTTTEQEDQDEEKWTEVDSVCTKEKTEEQVVSEVKVEKEEEDEETKPAASAASANSPRTRRAVAPKNGVPAKAKRGRK